eukprot:gene9823-20430_t
MRNNSTTADRDSKVFHAMETSHVIMSIIPWLQRRSILPLVMYPFLNGLWVKVVLFKTEKYAASIGSLEKCLSSGRNSRSRNPPYPWYLRTCTENAAKNGHIEILEWLRLQDSPCPLDVRTCSEASIGGQLGVLKWLRAQNPPSPWSEKACTEAASKGHLDILKWLRLQDPPCRWSEDTCAGAASEGHLNILIADACAQAASERHLDELQWLRSEDLPYEWSADTFGSEEMVVLDVLKWLRTQDPPCPWNEWTWLYASYKGHREVLKWLSSQ